MDDQQADKGDGSPIETRTFSAVMSFLHAFEATARRNRARTARTAPIDELHEAAVHHPDPFVRRECLAFLDHYANDASRAVFSCALHDPVEPVRHTALHSIACQTCPKDKPSAADIVPHLIELLVSDPSAELRHKSIPVLMRLGVHDIRARAAVARAAIEDDDNLVREVARAALRGEHVRRRKAYERGSRRQSRVT